MDHLRLHSSDSPLTKRSLASDLTFMGFRLIWDHADVIVSSTLAYYRTTEYYRNMTILAGGEFEFGPTAQNFMITELLDRANRILDHTWNSHTPGPAIILGQAQAEAIKTCQLMRHAPPRGLEPCSCMENCDGEVLILTGFHYFGWAQLSIDFILWPTREVGAKSGMTFSHSPKDDARLPKKLYSTTTSRSLLIQQVFKGLMQKRGPEVWSLSRTGSRRILTPGARQHYGKGTLWAGVAVSFCFLTFRVYVRLKIFRRLHIEDPFVLAAWLMNLANTIVWQKTAKKLYSVIAVESGQIFMPPPEYSSYLYIELQSLFASELLYYTALWSVKLSFLLFFRNLGNNIRRQMLLWCLAESRGLAECQSVRAVHRVPIHLRIVTVLDTTTDGLIILMSTNLLWNASIEIRKKLALTGIFSLTIFIIGVAIIRVVLTTSGSGLDLTWLLLWSGLEMTVAILVACLASFRILYTSSERSRRSALIDDQSNKTAERLDNGPGIPLNARVMSSTRIIASENTHHKRQTSAATFEEAILPMDNVHIQHKYSVVSGPRQRYEDMQSSLEIPVVRLHGHHLPSYIVNQDEAAFRGSTYSEY
ncbi:MAG: hypothetical protein ASARMPRED_003539 [Alectoria sarmentosa]|nr:MAG: hypothetical protein ASARMPRED_003539 [Alectoria sarmentosa]